MINQNLHRQPAALDSALHRQLKLKVPITDWSMSSQLNALFLAVAEFGDACKEFPIVFVKAGQEPDGSEAIAPIAVLGMVANDNLFLQGSQWRGQYMPAILRMYPFCIGRLDEERFAICLDMAFSGANQTEGVPVFLEDGQPAELLKTMQKQLENLETEIQRTRQVCKRIMELGLLTDMRFDVTLADGRQHTVDGFLTVDEKKVTELSDAVVGELHRNGVLGLIHLHWLSLTNMRGLAEWHAQRLGLTPAAVPAQAVG